MQALRQTLRLQRRPGQHVAIRVAVTRAKSARAQHRDELSADEADLGQTTAVDRYLTAFETGSLPEATCFERVRTRKALLRALVHEVTVQARGDILPVLRVPPDREDAKVREQTGLVGPTGFEPVTSRV